MGGLSRFEQKLEDLVSGAFARAFKGEVEPVELASALKRETDNGARILSRDRRLVPNIFVIQLSHPDHERLNSYGQTLIAELTGELQQHGQLQRYTFSGPIDITLAANERTPVGKFSVSARTGGREPPKPDPAARDGRTRIQQEPRPLVQPQAPPPLPHHPDRLVLDTSGKIRSLEPPGVVIGRGADADIQISDPGVSRRHAEIRLMPDADDRLTATLLDLGSTNGTLVNNHRVDGEVPLTDGDQIKIGNTTMTLGRRSGDDPRQPRPQRAPQAPPGRR